MPVATHHRPAAGLADRRREALGTLHVVDDRRTRIALEHVGREQHQLPVGVDDVSASGDDAEPVAGAYVRLLDRTGEFTAEVQSSATGYFRFYAAAGDWTLRTLYRGGSVDTAVTAEQGKAVEAQVVVPD